MKREPVAFYPLILAVFPILSVFASNLAYVPTSQLWRPLVVTLGITIGLWVLLGLSLRNVNRGAAAATVVVLCTFGFSKVANALGSFLFIGPVTVWAFLTLVLAGLAAWRLPNAKLLNVLAVAVGVISLSNIGIQLGKVAVLDARLSKEDVAGHQEGERPDVFYIILDGHGRSDAIRRAIGFDNSAFIRGLRERGFYVADGSHSNYCQTELSLSSSLNMDFIPKLLPKVKPDETERAPLGDLIDHNEVSRRFRLEGYRYVAVTTGFPPIRLEGADVHMRREIGRTMIEAALIAMTPLSVSTHDLSSQFIQRRQKILSAFADLRALAQPTPYARFVVAHMLVPHPPFVFGHNGEEVPHKGPFGYFDGSDYMTYVGTPQQYREGYAGQVDYIEKLTLDAVDAIVARADPARKPIIIIQGDHGSKVGLDQNSLAHTDVHEVFPILNAYLVTAAVRKDLRPTITPVNSFRLLLSDLFGERLPQLPDRSWYSTFPLPYRLTEVTDRIELSSKKKPEGTHK
jgi:hypothetical protein